MDTLLSASTSAPLANEDSELELLAADVLNGKLYTPYYIEFVQLLCNIPIFSIPGDEENQNITEQLQADLLDDNDHLNLDQIDLLYANESPNKKVLLELILSRTTQIIAQMGREQKEYEAEQIAQYEAKFEVPGYDFQAILDSTPQGGFYNPYTELIQTSIKLKISLQSILSIIEIPNKEIYVEVDHIPSFKKIPEYLAHLQMMLNDLEVPSLNYTKVLYKLLATLQSQYPTSKFNPFLEEQYKHLVKLLKAPSSLKRNVKAGKVLSDSNGRLIQEVYPSLMMEVFEYYLEIKPSLTYQKQLQFEKGLGMSPANGLLAITYETALQQGLTQ